MSSASAVHPDTRRPVKVGGGLVAVGLIWVTGVSAWVSLVLLPPGILGFASIWMLALLTMVCGGVVGVLPRAVLWARLTCWIGASVAAGAALGGVYVAAMVQSSDPNSDIAAAAGLFIVVVPGTIALFLAFGISFALGCVVRLLTRRSRASLLE